MAISKLNLKIIGFLVLPGMFLLMSACNNSSKSENNSTDKGSDTASISKTTQTNPGKKTGKATVRIEPADKSTAMKTDKEGYYNYTETEPTFSGGQGALETYIANNIQYPPDAIDNQVEGTVHVMFTIDEKGKTANAKTTGPKIGYGLDEEAVRVMNGMSDWTPGTIKGKKVKAWYSIPITYRLE